MSQPKYTHTQTHNTHTHIDTVVSYKVDIGVSQMTPTVDQPPAACQEHVHCTGAIGRTFGRCAFSLRQSAILITAIYNRYNTYIQVYFAHAHTLLISCINLKVRNFICIQQLRQAALWFPVFMPSKRDKQTLVSDT